MFTLLPYEHIREARLAPTATVSVGTEYFRWFSVVCARDEDDLDSFQFAGLSIRERVIGLLSYDHSHSRDTTILLPETVTVELGTALLAEEFSLPREKFRWSTPPLERYRDFA